jgi:hypothetical protein
MSVVSPATFDAKKLSISELKKLDNGSMQSYINYDGRRLRIQAPRLPIPMNASDYQNNGKFKVQVSFRDRASNPKVAAYIKMLEDIDNFVVEHATKNAGKWFKKPGASREMVADYYNNSVKVAVDKEGNPKDYPPTQSLALKQRNGAYDAELYDDKKRLMEGVTPIDVLRRGAEITPIIDATGIWVSALNKFGLTWKLHQARVDVPGEGGTAHGFVGLDDEEAASSVPVVAAGGAGATAAHGGAGISAAEEHDLMSAVMPSTDGGDDDEDEDEVIPAPPVPAKKPVAPPAPAPAPTSAPAVKKPIKRPTVTKP